jgi:hypothetical protein
VWRPGGGAIAITSRAALKHLLYASSGQKDWIRFQLAS